MQLFTLANAQHREKAVDVSVAILNHGILEDKLHECGVSTIILDETILSGVAILVGLARIMRSIKPDVVHTHRHKENVLGSIAARISGNIPSLRTVHGDTEHLFQWHQLHKVINDHMDWCCGRFVQKKIVAVSADLAVKLSSKFPLRLIEVIENGIDVEAVEISDEDYPPAPNGDNEVITIGIAGRLAPVKRVDLFIEAASVILSDPSDYNVCFHIYGDGPLRKDLEDLCCKRKITPFVEFMGHCDDIHARLKKLDLLVMTSDHEGLPMTLLEAMVLKTPIIAHATGGIPVLLDNGASGILVNDHSISGYAIAIKAAIQDKRMREDITVRAYERVRQCYSATLNADSYLKLYSAISQGMTNDIS